MNSAFLLQLLTSQAPRLIQALKSKPAGTFPNIENSIADAVNFNDLESQYGQAYNHISSDLVPDSTNMDVALGNLNKSLGITNPMSTPNQPYMNGDIARQLMDDDAQHKINLSSLYQILNQK